MDTMILVAIGLFVLLGFGLIVIGLTRSREPSTVEDRLAQFGALDLPPTLEEIELAQPFSERILMPLLGSLAQFAMRLTPQKSAEATQHQLDLAGNPYGWDPGKFLGVRLLSTLLLGGLGFALVFIASNVDFARRILILVAAVVMGYFLPTLWLRIKISNRQKSIIKALPDALDLLTICVEAGLGFDAALAKVSEKWDNDLSLAFTRVLQEIQLGKLRREALREMADRMEIRDVSTFVAAIVQAEQLGVSIARVLRIQSDQMRIRRRQRAEELARSAQVKILPPVAFLIFPSIFIVLLGPAVITFMVMENPIF